MKKFNSILFAVAFMLFSFSIQAQSFEGWIAYKMEMANPNPEMIPAEKWEAQMKEAFGEKGYMPQKYFYKGNKYMSEIAAGTENGYQTYNPEDGLLYSWQEGSSSAVTLDSKKYMDSFVEFIESDETETILGIECKLLTIKSKLGEVKCWYNSDHFKIDATLYEGHIYGHFVQMIEKIGCLPLKMEQKGLMGQVTVTALDHKEEPVEDSQFIIPTFKEVTASAMN